MQTAARIGPHGLNLMSGLCRGGRRYAVAPPPPKRPLRASPREETLSLEVIAPYVHSVGDGGPFGSRVIALALHGAGVWWPFFFEEGSLDLSKNI